MFKEALCILMGITTEGTKEVLDYKLYQQESCGNCQEILQVKRSKGLKNLLFVTDVSETS